MKKLVLLTVVFMLAGFTAMAQNYIVVDSEKIFKSIAAYNEANSTLEKLAETYQKNIDDEYEKVEQMYNDYIQQKAYLSESTRQSREDAIINREKEILAYQEQIFGQEGEWMKKRVELITPIQEKVFGVITKYAEANGQALVMDINSNPTVLYYSPKADKTEEIIKLLK